jgi:GWxTD domain-containing protein
MKRNLLFFLAAVIIIPALIIGCSNGYVDEINRGEGYEYRPGYPELRIAATGFINENNKTQILVSGDVVYGSLIYSKKEDSLKAKMSIEISIYEDTDDNVEVAGTQFEESIATVDDNISNNQDSYRFERVLDVPAGNYIVEVSVFDETSDKLSTRITNTSLPNPEDDISNVTDIQVLGKNSESSNTGFYQVTTFDIPSKFDSLKFVFQVTNNKPDAPISIESRLLKFSADSTPARPMNYNNYSPSSIQYKGIDYDEYDIVQSSVRDLQQPGSVFIEFAYSELPRGNYRLEVTSNEGQEDELYRARDFSIKSENYPSPSSAIELARPLVYIMNDDEYEALMSIKDPDSLKAAVDRFWLTNIQNSSTARSVISLYYERVEEANKQFSNFKEGWKTDPGMMYILFGPPWYNDRFSDEMVWSYSYNRQDPEKTFYFYRTKINNKFYPFTNYILSRDSFYYSVNYQQREKWRTGIILTDNL